MALSANNYDQVTNPTAYIPMPVKGSTHIYAGAATMVIGGTGYLVPAADTSGGVYMGIAPEEADNSGSATDGLINAKVVPPINEPFQTFKMTSPTVANIGSLAYFTADDTVAASSSNHVIAGVIKKIVVAATAGLVLVDTSVRAV